MGRTVFLSVSELVARSPYLSLYEIILAGYFRLGETISATLACDKHRAMGSSEDPMRHAAQNDPFQFRKAAGTHDDQVAAAVSGFLHDYIFRPPFPDNEFRRHASLPLGRSKGLHKLLTLLMQFFGQLYAALTADEHGDAPVAVQKDDRRLLALGQS